MKQKQIKIILADDKLERREEIGNLLEKKGYQVYKAKDGMSALGMIKCFRRPDLILTDTKMPCLTGPELIEELRKRGNNVPVIGMSNREEARALYQYFWNKNEPKEILFDLIKQLTSKSPA
jgi:CheY-like chemotaxis protein